MKKFGDHVIFYEQNQPVLAVVLANSVGTPEDCLHLGFFAAPPAPGTGTVPATGTFHRFAREAAETKPALDAADPVTASSQHRSENFASAVVGTSRQIELAQFRHDVPPVKDGYGWSDTGVNIDMEAILEKAASAKAEDDKQKQIAAEETKAKAEAEAKAAAEQAKADAAKHAAADAKAKAYAEAYAEAYDKEIKNPAKA